MKARRTARVTAIQPYVIGDLLLEADYAASAGPVLLSGLKPLGGGPAQPDAPKAEHIVDIIKPKADDYPALKSTLQVLKFSDANVISYHEAIGSLINLASGMIWGVGAVMSIASFVGKLLGEEEDAVSKKLEHISQRVDQIYGYLAQQEQRGLHDQASAWRRDLTVTRRAVQHVKASRSQQNLDTLTDLAVTCDQNLLDMLNPGKGTIAFLRAAQGYVPTGGQGGHWIDSAVSPFMNLASGAPINYRDPAQDLQATIWDAGHYIDVLVQALNDRLLLAAAIEPAFRTTGHGLGNIKDVMLALNGFLHQWRASLLVANPLAGLNNGGELLHPITDAPFGVVIGAVDPVSGIGFYDTWWSDFTLVNVWEGSISAKGAPDHSFAKDPALALARALDLQPRLLDGTIRASGMHKLAELRRRLQDIVVRSTVESDFVDLPNATFDRTSLTGPEQAPPVDLGFVGQYSKNPGKQYSAERYSQSFTKRFRFAMPLRADVSLIQPGYRLQIGTQSIVVIPFANAPADGSPVKRFPDTPISDEVRGEDWRVYDVYQSRVFTEADEDRFEGADPAAALGPLGRAGAAGAWSSAVLTDLTPASGARFDIERLQPLGKPERLFLNERPGYVALKVDIAFEADLANPDYPFVGYATVTLTNLEPERFRDGAIVPISVYETRIDAEGERDEWLADHMTIHCVPSFLAVEPGYFEDRREGFEAMDAIFGSVNDEYVRFERDLLPVGPEWQMRRRWLTEQGKVEALQRFAEAGGPRAEQALQRFAMPRLQR